jgi:protein arginine kinase activator
MKCDLCDKPAVVHEVTIRNGVKAEVHLCEEHARAAGIQIPGTQPIDQLLTQFVLSKQQPSKSKKSTKSKPRSRRAGSVICPGCGLAYTEFRKTGVLGCGECYEAFGEPLASLIEQSQNGGASHRGKCPIRGGVSIDRQLQIRELVRELDEAVAAEQYERAVELRDRLRAMGATTPAPDSAGAND